MRALILNSGQGSRMGALTLNLPKCMCPVGEGQTILSRQLSALKRVGIVDVVITTGPFERLLQDYARQVGEGLNIRFAHNPLYATTNYIYSIHTAKQYLKDDILLLHGDLVLEDSILVDLIESKKSCVTVAAGVPLPEKDFKARIKGGMVNEIGVDIFGCDCVACQPAYKWLRTDFERWLAEIERFCSSGNTTVYAENAWNEIGTVLPLAPIEIAERLCREIDDKDDLSYVLRLLADQH